MKRVDYWRAICIRCFYEETAKLWQGKAPPWPHCPQCGSGVNVSTHSELR